MDRINELTILEEKYSKSRIVAYSKL
ncbi:hypothetical protein OH492_27350 [Vibrio chagasii]|nr:hypothetical protein [Vibrio chagasii]